ncbi:MAG: hypothetical protein PVH45_04130 [Candidatus Omnitrophota bacterium]|jgi:hypothetical protein
MNIPRLIASMTSMIMICFAAHANDLSVNSKVYFGGLNLPNGCADIEDATKVMVNCGDELPEKFEVKSSKAPEDGPDRGTSLVSDSMNAYIEASRRL